MFSVDHRAVAVKLKLAEPIAYPKGVAYEHNEVCLFDPKAIYNIRNSQ